MQKNLLLGPRVSDPQPTNSLNQKNLLPGPGISDPQPARSLNPKDLINHKLELAIFKSMAELLRYFLKPQN